MARKKNKRKMHKRKFGNQDKVIFKKVVVEERQQDTPKRTTAAELFQRINKAKETQKKIVPPNMTYGEYMEYLKEKRQELEEKKDSN